MSYREQYTCTYPYNTASRDHELKEKKQNNDTVMWLNVYSNRPYTFQNWRQCIWNTLNTLNIPKSASECIRPKQPDWGSTNAHTRWHHIKHPQKYPDSHKWLRAFFYKSKASRISISWKGKRPPTSMLQWALKQVNSEVVLLLNALTELFFGWSARTIELRATAKQ